jgi:hypothetical protein
MTMVFNSLASFAAHLVTMEADVKLACDAAVVKASKLVAKTAKGMLGHEQPFWPALKPETIERKARPAPASVACTMSSVKCLRQATAAERARTGQIERRRWRATPSKPTMSSFSTMLNALRHAQSIALGS